MKNKPLILVLASVAVLFCGPAALPVSAQLAAPTPAPVYQPLSDPQLDQLLAPIALYPDPLLAQILPAATLPTQIVLADRYLASGGDPNLAYQQPWDPSVQALVRYPTVLQYLDDNLGWTTEVGQAFLNQQLQVMDSIQRLRLSAENFGNLMSTPQQQVVNDNGYIEILPVDPDLMYLPSYQPDMIFYQAGYPISFGVGCPIGVWLAGDFDWRQHHLFFWNRDHPRPANWWREQPAQRTAWMAREGSVWRAEDHPNLSAARGNDRGYQPAAAQGNNSVVWASHLPTQPRAAAEPRPAAARNLDEFHFTAPAAESARSANEGAFVGSDNAHEVRNDSQRGEQSMRAAEPSAPVHVEAPHPAPAFQGGGSHGSSEPSRH